MDCADYLLVPGWKLMISMGSTNKTLSLDLLKKVVRLYARNYNDLHGQKKTASISTWSAYAHNAHAQSSPVQSSPESRFYSDPETLDLYVTLTATVELHYYYYVSYLKCKRQNLFDVMRYKSVLTGNGYLITSSYFQQ